MSACRVAIAGFGTVGRSVARLIGEVAASELRVVAVCNRGVESKRVEWLDSVRWTDRIDDLLGEDVDVVVELIGGRAPAEEWIRRALEAGKSVVTANKQVIAHAGEELLEVARRAGRHLRFEGAVGGGIPIVRAIESGLAGDRLTRVAGILNGTCNYILTRMEENGIAFDEALREAQTLGFAEANPAEDIDGLDARAKLAILALVALGCRVQPEAIACRSIAGVEPIDFVYARRLGCAIRQVASVQRDRVGTAAALASVGPALVSDDSPLARVRGSENVVLVRGEFGGETSFCGRGAGGDPTAVAVVSDLLAIARTAAPPAPTPRARAVALSSDFVRSFYVRFTVADRSGIIAALAGVLARHGISIDAVLQEPGCSPSRLPFVMTLAAAPASRVDAAVAEAATLDFHVVPPLALPLMADGARDAPGT